MGTDRFSRAHRRRTGHQSATAGRLSDRLGQRGQVVLVPQRLSEPTLTAQHLPPPRHGDTCGVRVTQIP